MDRLSVMVNSIKNAAMARKSVVEVFHSNECEGAAKVLKDRGFLSEVKSFKDKDTGFKKLHLGLAYVNDLPVITDAIRISKPGKRVYVGYASIRKITAGFGVRVLSTSRGIMSGEDARKKKLGGEVICEVK